jgi:hypothetical protein
MMNLSWWGVSKNRVGTQGSLERLESSFRLWSPLEGLLLLSEFGHSFAVLANLGINHL